MKRIFLALIAMLCIGTVTAQTLDKNIFEAVRPYRRATAVTPSDSTVLPLSKALFVGGAGALTVRMSTGGNVTFAAVPAGTTIRIEVDRVLSTGTGATSIVELY